MSVLKVPALRIKQGKGRALYSFSINGKDIPSIASISRAKRNDGDFEGYQRPEVASHINEIKKYIESDNPMIPNALVIAFNETVKFESVDDEGQFGFLLIPKVEVGAKPGWVVDGQQRAAALREADVADFHMPVSAFITDDAQDQREQFILVNSTKPLPKGLIYELLPFTETRLSSVLQKKRFPASILERLNRDEGSPLFQLVKTATNPDGVVKDNSLLKIIESSLVEGSLYRFRDPATGQGDIDSMVAQLSNFFAALAEVFPEAWAVDPKRSRLMHGAGMAAMGHVMDAISERYHTVRLESVTSVESFKKDLVALKPFCRWTNGYWDFGAGQKVKWNELQNLSKDIQLVTAYLMRVYRSHVWTD